MMSAAPGLFALPVPAEMASVCDPTFPTWFITPFVTIGDATSQAAKAREESE